MAIVGISGGRQGFIGPSLKRGALRNCFDLQAWPLRPRASPAASVLTRDVLTPPSHLLSTHYMLPRTLSFDPDNAPVDRRDYRLREVGALTQGDADSKSCCCTWAQVRPLPTAIVREPKPSPSSACSWVVSATRAAAPSWEGQSLEQSTPPPPAAKDL